MKRVMMRTGAFSDDSIIYYIKETARSMYEGEMADFIRLCARIRDLRKLRAIPCLKDYFAYDFVAQMHYLGSQYYYVAVSQSFAVQEQIGALLFENGLKFYLSHDNYVRQLQYRAMYSGAALERLLVFYKKQPTACQNMCVVLLKNCRTAVEPRTLDFMSQYLLLVDAFTAQFRRLHAKYLFGILTAALYGKFDKDDMQLKQQACAHLLALPRDITGCYIDYDAFSKRIEGYVTQPYFKQAAPKVLYIVRSACGFESTVYLDDYALESKFYNAKQLVEFVDYYVAFCASCACLEKFQVAFYHFCQSVQKAQFCIGGIESVLTARSHDSQILNTILETGVLEQLTFLQFSVQSSPVIALVKIMEGISVPPAELQAHLLNQQQAILGFLTDGYQKEVLKQVRGLRGFRTFLQTQLAAFDNFTQYEEGLMKSKDLVDVDNIPEEKVLKQGMSLKQEYDVKQHNKARDAFIEQKRETEAKLREQLAVRVSSVFDRLTMLYELTCGDTDVFVVASSVALTFLQKFAAKMATCFGMNKRIVDTVSLFTSRTGARGRVLGLECQPSLCDVIFKVIGIEDYCAARPSERSAFYYYISPVASFSDAVTQDLKVKLQSSFSQLSFAQAVAVYSGVVDKLTLAYKSQLAQYLTQAYEILARIDNSIEDFAVLYLVFKLHESNYYTLLKVVYNLVQCCKRKDVYFDYHFLTPIIDNLVEEDDSCKQLAYLSLSHIPTNQSVNLSYDSYFKLLLAEYLGDSVKRFFLSAGNRHAYIAHLKVNIDELFEECFVSKYSKYLLELLPAAVQTVCEQLSEQKFIASTVVTLLRYHFDNQLSLEESRFDTASNGAYEHYNIRRCIWRIFDRISKMLVSYNALIPYNLPVGILCFAHSSKFPIIARVEPTEEQAELRNRMNILRKTIADDAFKTVESIYYDEIVVSRLRTHQFVPVEVDPRELSLIGTIFERFLHNGLFEYDRETAAAAKSAITSIVYYMGLLYNQQIQYFIETNRYAQIPKTKINKIVYFMTDRLMVFANNIKRYGVPHRFTIDQSQLEGIDNDIVGIIIELLGSIAGYLLYEDEYRWKIVQFVEQAVYYAPLTIAGNMSNALQDVWQQILSGTVVQTAANAKCEHYRYSGPEEFARRYLVPRYIDTVKFSSADFPGALFCLVGITKYLGLSFIFYRENIIDTVVCYCIKYSDTLFYDVGLTMIAQLILAFKRKMEPYYCIFISDILYLSASQDKGIGDKARQVINVMLKNLSLFGVSSVLNVLVDALQNDVDWQLKKGACDLVYQLCSNSARIPLTYFRYLMAKMLPVLLPALQPNINHSHYMVKDSALSTIEKVADSVQNQQVKQISKKIIYAYSESSMNRQILIQISYMTFTQQLDAASLTLMYPICDSVLSANSSYIYGSYNDAMKNIHTKIIACSCLTLLSKISKTQDFRYYIPRLISLLKRNLDESNDEIRQSAANAMADMLYNYPVQRQETEAELWGLMQSKLTCYQQHGVAQALVNISFMNGTWQGLLWNVNAALTANFAFVTLLEKQDSYCFNVDYTKMDMHAIALTLLYLPYKVIELDDDETHTLFMAYYFSQCLEFVFYLVRRPEMQQIEDYLYKMARQLATSFLQKQAEIRQIIRAIRANVLAAGRNARLLAITLIGDVISELGSTDASNVYEVRDEIQELRDELIAVSFQKDERKQTKVFIPEQAIGYATRTIGEDEYYKLMASLFVIRCDDTHGIRNAAVGMWKLTTFKPMSAIAAMIPYMFDTLSGLLDCHYAAAEADIDYKELVANVVHEMLTTVHQPVFQQFVTRLYDALEDDAISDTKLLHLLDIFSFIAKSDESGLYITQKLIDRLPGLLASAANKNIITAAAQLFTSLKQDVSGVLDSLVNPQIQRLTGVQNAQEITAIVDSVLLITQTEPQMLSLLDFSLNKSAINANFVQFYEQFYKRSATLRQLTGKFFDFLMRKLSAEIDEIAESPAQLTSDTAQGSFIYQILRASATNACADSALHATAYDWLLQFVFDNIYQVALRQKRTALAVLILLFEVFPANTARDTALIMALVNAFTTNTNNVELAGILGYCLVAFNKMFEYLTREKPESVPQFMRLFVSQFYLNLRRVIPMSEAHCIFLSYNKYILEIFKILCWALPSKSGTDAEKEQATKAMILMMLLTHQTHAVSTGTPLTKFTYDDVYFTISVTPDSSKLVFLQASALIGRIIIAFKQEISDMQRALFCSAVRTVFRLCGMLYQFEMAIRTDIERKCLLFRNYAIQESAVETLVELNVQSLRKEYNVVALASLLFTPERQLRRTDTYTSCSILIALERLLRASALVGKPLARPGELVIEQGELYEQLSSLVFEQVCLQTEHEQILEQASRVVAECVLSQEALDGARGLSLLQRLVTNPERQLYLAKAQLSVLQAVIRAGINANAAHRVSKLLAATFALIKQTPVSYLDEKTTFCPDSQLEELGRSLCVCAWLVNLYAATSERYSANQARDCYSKLASILGRKLESCSYECKCRASYAYAELAFIENADVRKQLAIVSLEFMQYLLMDRQVGNVAQTAIIEFMRLRVGPDEFQQVYQVVSLGDTALADDMKHRVDYMCKQIKSGKL